MKETEGGISLRDVEEMGVFKAVQWMTLFTRVREAQEEALPQRDVPSGQRSPDMGSGSVLDLEWERNKRQWLAQQPQPRR